eukprot:TRINITY_DN53222_c0_g1_i2.p1 TRINITY_DN53222_c0_g1~~TRINITY_DN53222_c0_g1_i2.p1  ORF type:complete len:587 (-),score=139.49 TRINITY_DN53222_c0_g1_i2:42-1802(-)
MERVRVCGECKQRKQRCDEKRPCSRCIMRGVAHQCKYPNEETVNPLSHFVSTMRYNLTSSYLGHAVSDDDRTIIDNNGGNPFEIPPALLRTCAAAEMNQLPRSLYPISYPFTGRENYYTSLWLQPRPDSITEIARGIPKRFSADFFREMLIDRPVTWKWLLHSLEFLSDPATTKIVHDQIIRKVSDASASSGRVTLTNRVQETSYKRITAASQVFSNTEKIHMSAEEEEIVKTLFGDVEAFKGVAFVEFDKSEAAMSAVQRADVSTDDLPVRLRRMVQKGKTISETAKQLALEGVGGLWVEGRLLYVQLALPREDAKKMETEHAEQKKKQDKRNLWLAEEGLIVAGTPAAEGMSSKDIERRTKLWREAKTKLAFPNYCISKTRLSVHNMPANLNEEGLRDLFKEASDNAPIKQVKVVREEAKEGQKIGRSKRFGFVEFQDHEDALNALRKVNNNPQVWTNQARPIVAFAVDDVRMLHIQELKRKAMHERAKRTGEPQEDQVSSSNNDRGRGRGRGRGGTGAGRGRGRGRGRGGGFGASGRSSSRGGRSSEGGGRMSGVKRKSGQSSESSQRSRSNSTRPSKQRRTK